MWISQITVVCSAGVIAAVGSVHDRLPLIATLYRLQLPVCLFVFVCVKSVAHRCCGPPRAPRPRPRDIYVCVRTVVSEMYATFLVLLYAKATLDARATPGAR